MPLAASAVATVVKRRILKYKNYIQERGSCFRKNSSRRDKEFYCPRSLYSTFRTSLYLRGDRNRLKTEAQNFGKNRIIDTIDIINNLSIFIF